MLRGTYAYTHQVPTDFTTGDMASDPSVGRSTISPGILVGLDALGRAPLWTSFTEPEKVSGTESNSGSQIEPKRRRAPVPVAVVRRAPTSGPALA